MEPHNTYCGIGREDDDEDKNFGKPVAIFANPLAPDGFIIETPSLKQLRASDAIKNYPKDAINHIIDDLRRAQKNNHLPVIEKVVNKCLPWVRLVDVPFISDKSQRDKG